MTTAGAAYTAYSPTPGFWDEAVLPDGRPREASADALRAVAAHAPAELAAAVRATVAADDVAFRAENDEEAFVVDPVPRVFGAQEWAALEAGLSQRVRALNAYVADVYGERRIFAEGVVPARLLDADGHEPEMRGVPVPGGVWTSVAGLDIVRDDTGRLLVLEDNLTTPSGLAYAVAARAAVTAHLRPERPPRPLDGSPALLAGALRAAAPDGIADPAIVVLTDGPGNSAYWEHRWLASELGIPLVAPQHLELAGDRLRHRGRVVDVVYRRTDRDALGDAVGALLGPPLRAGALGVVNGYGAAVADDKLAHVYVEAMVRFYLGEAPRLPSAPSLDLGRPADLERALDTLADLVVKPRHGHGGIGVVIAGGLSGAELDALRKTVAARPEDFIAQPRIALSLHPTVIGDRLAPRHVDLRPFVFLHGPDDARVLPGGLTRVAFDEGELVVNSTRNGGAKDTWVL